MEVGLISICSQIIISNFVIWAVTVSVVQLSILLFYIRMFGSKRVFRYIAYTMVALITGYAIATAISEILSCVPVSKQWDPTEPGTCDNSTAYCSAIGLIHVIFDLGSVVLPMPLICKLQTSRSNKVVLTILLCIGLA